METRTGIDMTLKCIAAGVSVPLKDYAKHLEGIHKCLKYKNQTPYIPYNIKMDNFNS